MSEFAAPENTRYDERDEPGNGWRHRLQRTLLAWPARYRHLLVRRELWGQSSAPGLPLVTAESLHRELRCKGLAPELLKSYFALATERGFDGSTISGALALIRGMAVQCDGPLLQADMIALASAAVAMSGQVVHVLTPDDTVTEQLQSVLQPWLQQFGLRAVSIDSDCSVSQRRVAYRAPVTVLSAREALRDYLDDRLQMRHQAGEISRKLGRLVGRNPLQAVRMCGLPFGLIVDANQILIEQACAPMTMAGRTDPARERVWAEKALLLASPLQDKLHFTMGKKGDIQLTDAGRFQLDRGTDEIPDAWRNEHRRHADIALALMALALVPGQHYRVVAGQVEILPGVPQTDGLLQLLQLREDVPVTGRVIVRGKLTYQRFFRRYQQLAAVCGDIRHIRGELWQIYGLSSFAVTPAPAESTADEVLLSESDERLLAAMSKINGRLSQRFGEVLAAWHKWNRRKKGKKLRRSLLHLDNQTGSITAFSGRAE